MGTAMSMDLDADWEEALDRYEKNVLLQISQLSITAEDEEEDPTSDSGSEQSSECVCCQTQYPPSEMIEAKCRHFYCNTCLTALFERSLRDESFCPPRCCTTPITLRDAEGFISHKLAAKPNLLTIHSTKYHKVTPRGLQMQMWGQDMQEMQAEGPRLVG
ncbi:unnamed protein product [Penicillium bialowiezense]